VLGTVDATVEVQIRLAHDYLLGFEPRLKGWRTTAGQALCFPRSGLVIHNRCIPVGVIPPEVKNLICQLVMEQAEGSDLMPVLDGRVATTETVGPITTVYAVNSASPTFPKVEALLAPLLQSASGGLTSLRV
jgi:hypothetical protein